MNKSITVKNELYKCLEFFMLRTPLLPINFLRDILEKINNNDEHVDLLNELKKTNYYMLIRESIAISSPSLNNAINNFEEIKDIRKKNQVVSKTFRYLNRMSTRTTPYGIFAGISMGKIENETQISLGDLTKHQKRARVDMEWLLNVIQILEKDIEIVQQLKVQTNKMVYRTGSRVKLPFKTLLRLDNEKRGLEDTSIRLTTLVEYVLELAEESIPFQELLDLISMKFTDAPMQKIKNFAWNLFQNEFLLSELRPPVTTDNPLEYLLNKLIHINGIDSLRADLKNIQGKISVYNELELGTGYEYYLELVQDMTKIVNVKNPIQVDLSQKNNIVFNQLVSDEMSKVAEILIRLSPNRTGMNHLDKYKREFAELYGENREVPVLELLDEDIGLGAPPTYNNPQGWIQPNIGSIDRFEKRTGILMKWFIDAIAKGESEIILNNNMLSQLETNESIENKSMRSLELYCNIVATSQEALDRGEFTMILGPNPGSYGAGKTFGRFVDILDSEINQYLENIHEIEQKLEPDSIFAEISYQDFYKRSANVTRYSSKRPYEIPVGVNSSKDESHTLPLSDLLVGLKNNRFYLKSKKLNRIVIPVTGHMLSYTYAPNIYRFLNELSFEGVKMWDPNIWRELGNSPYLPRLKYGRTIISPARWKLDKKTPQFINLNGEDWINNLKNWMNDYKVPRYVYLGNGDHRILLDLNNHYVLNELKKEYFNLKDDSFLVITEMGNDFSGVWAKSDEGHYIIECVFSLIRSRDSNESELGTNSTKPLELVESIPEFEKIKVPGGDIIYIKLYGANSRTDELISYHIRSFCENVEEEGIVDYSFFIRYRDPVPHIRLRFFGDSKRINSILLPRIHSWAKDLQSEGLLNRLVIDTYYPEIERYGGVKLINFAEKLFSIDSKAILNIISLQRSKQITIDIDIIGVINTLDILDSFLDSYNVQFEWLESRVSYKNYINDFRANRNLFMKFGNSSNEWEGLRTHVEGQLIYEAIKMRRSYIKSFSKSVFELEQIGSITNNSGKILDSLIHMSLNRLIGINPQKEGEIMTLALHTLRSTRYLRQNFINSLN